MPIQREQIESIVKSLDTGTLVEMLKVAGIHLAGDEEGNSAEQMIEAAGQDKIEPWNDRKVDIEQSVRGPINDPATYMAQQPQQMQRPEYLNTQQPPAAENWMSNGPIAQ